MWSERIGRLVGPSFWTRRAVVLSCLFVAALVLTWIEVDEYLTCRALKQYATSIGGRVAVISKSRGYSFEKSYEIHGPERDLSNDEEATLESYAKHLHVWRIHKQQQVILSYRKNGAPTAMVLP